LVNISKVAERLVEQKIYVGATVKKNNLPLFIARQKKGISKDAMKVSSLKSVCSLFAQLYIACQIRESRLEEFFSHDNQAFLPSLSTQAGD
jgi:hypothetical protein